MKIIEFVIGIWFDFQGLKADLNHRAYIVDRCQEI